MKCDAWHGIWPRPFDDLFQCVLLPGHSVKHKDILGNEFGSKMFVPPGVDPVIARRVLDSNYDPKEQPVPLPTIHVDGVITRSHKETINDVEWEVVDAFKVTSVMTSDNVPSDVECILLPGRKRKFNESLAEYARQCFVWKKRG